MSVVKQAENKKSAEYRVAIKKAFGDNGGDVKATARQLGVSREWVRRWCKRLDIDANIYRTKTKWIVLASGKHLGDVMASSHPKALSEAARVYGNDVEDPGTLEVMEVSR